VKAAVKTGMVYEVQVRHEIRGSNALLRQSQHRFGLKLCVDDQRWMGSVRESRNFRF